MLLSMRIRLDINFCSPSKRDFLFLCVFCYSDNDQVHCLVDVPVCYESPYNVLIPDGDNGYTPGYYLSDSEWRSK